MTIAPGRERTGRRRVGFRPGLQRRRSHPRRRARRVEVPPRLAEGIELVGRFEDSGLKEPPYIARRADGQVIQLPPLLYVLAEEVDGKREYDEIAERVTERFGRGVSGDNVRFLIEKKLRPLGVLAAADGSSPRVRKVDPLLALRFRTALVPERVVHAITTLFKPLFWPPVIVAVLGGLAALDGWLFFVHGVAQPTRDLLYQPALLLMVLGLVSLSAAFHECGHATACRYGGAKPGVMGAGIFIVWPAFYTDVTDAYRLNRAGRLRTDLGGVYFNGIFSLLTFGAYFLTGFEPLLIIVLVQHMEVLRQILPFVRLDGYYVLSDLTGVPDIVGRVKPTLKSMVPGQETHPRVEELKPWVRVATSAYVVLLIPVIALVFLLLILNAPRVIATAWDSLFVQADKISAAVSGGKVIDGLAGGVQVVALVLPILGMTATGAKGSHRLGGLAWRATDGRPALRGGLVAAGLAGAAIAAYTLFPNGDYRPIQPGEKGTLTGAAEQIAAIPTGRPALTAERERELGGAPTVRESGGDFRRMGDPEQRDPDAPARGEPGFPEDYAPEERPAEEGETQPGGTAPPSGQQPSGSGEAPAPAPSDGTTTEPTAPPPDEGATTPSEEPTTTTP